MEHGDSKLTQICGTVAADEKRHEIAYIKIVVDPDGSVATFAEMMRKKITMPAHLMYDDQDDNFSSISQLLHKDLGFALPMIMLIYWSSWWIDGKLRS
ncbi:hypothetical protein CRYUN_Cryun11dG0082000 [Craigia yunnanensis]